MPYRFELDAGHGVLAIRFSGTVTDAELVAYYEEAPRYVAHYRPRAGLTDFLGVTKVDVSSAIVQRLAALPPIFPDPAPRVVVAPSDLTFGLSRMFKSTFSAQREALHIVRTEQAALDYLGIRGELQFRALPALDTIV